MSCIQVNVKKAISPKEMCNVIYPLKYRMTGKEIGGTRTINPNKTYSEYG